VKKYSGWSGRKRFQICRRCGSFDTVKDGYLQGKQQFKCNTCRRYFTAYGKLRIIIKNVLNVDVIVHKNVVFRTKNNATHVMVVSKDSQFH
jgi:hypothetical protein